MGPVGSLFRRSDSELIEREGWYQLITPSTPVTSANQIVLSDLTKDDADVHIDEVFACYAAHNVAFKWAVYPWSLPTDLGARLSARGMNRAGVCAMVASTSLQINASAEIATERTTPATLDTFMDVMAKGWEMDADETRFFSEEFLRRLSGPTPQVHLFVASIDGTPAACGATILKADGSGFLVGAVVIEAFRGRGLYRALLKYRAAALRDENYEIMTTHGLRDTSAPMLTHFGFETVFQFSLYDRQLDPA